MKISAAYIRVSTDDQTEYSPDSQIKLLRDYAKTHDMMLPDEFIFRDDGLSGRKAEKRPDFLRMIATARQKPAPFEVILVWKFSRFARNQEESIVYKSLLKRESNIDVISVSEPLIDGPFGSLIERIIEWMDAFYSIRLSDEVKRGMKEKVSRGEPVSIPAFGYDIVDKRYVINSETAPIVKMIFGDFIGGMGCRDLAMKLNSMGIPTRRGNRWENRTVEYVLNNPVYIGKLRWNPTGRTQRAFDNPNIIIVNSDHEPIISMETWERAQEQMAQVKKMYSRYARQRSNSSFMLQGIVKCSNCGSTLTMSANGTSLQCHAYAKGKCPISHSITLARLNSMVLSVMEASLQNETFEITHTPAPEETNERAISEKQIQRERQKLDRIREAYENGIDTLQEYKDNKEKIMWRISELERKLSEQPQEIDKQAFSKKVQGILEQLKNTTKSEAEKNVLIRSIVDHIVFDRRKSQVHIFYYV